MLPNNDHNLPLVLTIRQGITAAKAGQRSRARTLLTDAVEQDPEHVDAWFWLSQVVDELTDQRLCLENVLALDPEHAMAQSALVELSRREQAAAVPEDETRPDSQATADVWQNKPFQHRSTFDDVWSDEDSHLCGYCAAEVSLADKRCPACQRKLFKSYYAYEKPSVNFWVYLCMLGGVWVFFILNTTAQLFQSTPSIAGWLRTGILVLFLATGIAVYFRQAWAHTLSVVLLVLMMFAELRHLVRTVTGANESPIVEVTTAFVRSFMGRASAVQAVYLGFLFASLLVGIFLVRADFEKRRARLLAHATRRATTASAFYLTGRSHADRGLWGAAIRNWQHAVGKDPTNVQFQRTLGLAYARLGFYDRSLDTLRWARWRAISPSARAEFDEMIAVIEAKADPTNTGSAESNTQ